MEGRRNPASGKEHGEHTWCAACERVSRTAAWDQSLWSCPHCGGTARDARLWEEVRLVSPSYPEAPAPGERYPWSNPGGG